MTIEEKQELTKNVMILQDMYNYINDRIKFLESMIDYNLESNEDEAIKYMYSKLELTTLKNMIEGSKHEENNK